MPELHARDRLDVDVVGVVRLLDELLQRADAIVHAILQEQGSCVLQPSEQVVVAVGADQYVEIGACPLEIPFGEPRQAAGPIQVRRIDALTVRVVERIERRLGLIVAGQEQHEAAVRARAVGIEPHCLAQFIQRRRQLLERIMRDRQLVVEIRILRIHRAQRLEAVARFVEMLMRAEGTGPR